MTAARIPFTPDDEGAIRMLMGTMMFLMVVNFLFGGLGVLGGCLSFVGVPARVAIHPMAGVGALLTALMIVLYCGGMIAQAALLLQTRSSLQGVLDTDTEDQALLAQAFRKLRVFFLIEAVLFLVAMGLQCGGFITQVFGPLGQVMGAGL